MVAGVRLAEGNPILHEVEVERFPRTRDHPVMFFPLTVSSMARSGVFTMTTFSPVCRQNSSWTPLIYPSRPLASAVNLFAFHLVIVM